MPDPLPSRPQRFYDKPLHHAAPERPGDKRTLFAVALEPYCRTRTHPLIARIEIDHPGAAAIPAWHRVWRIWKRNCAG